MWWIYLIFALILLIYCILFIIAYGIKFVLRVDADNLSICLKCYILDYIEVFCIKFLECQGSIYYQINKGQLKTLKTKESQGEEEGGNNEKKLKKGAYLSNLWSKRPQIKIRQLNVDYSTDFEELKNRAIFDGLTVIASNNLMTFSGEKLQIADFHIENICDKSNFVGVEIQCVLGFSLFKLAFYGLYAMMSKKKYQVAS